MVHWVDLAHSVQMAVVGVFASSRGLGALCSSRFRDRRWPAARPREVIHRLREAFREAAREEKVALLGLVLVLAFLTWP